MAMSEETKKERRKEENRKVVLERCEAQSTTKKRKRNSEALFWKGEENLLLGGILHEWRTVMKHTWVSAHSVEQPMSTVPDRARWKCVCVCVEGGGVGGCCRQCLPDDVSRHRNQ